MSIPEPTVSEAVAASLWALDRIEEYSIAFHQAVDAQTPEEMPEDIVLKLDDAPHPLHALQSLIAVASAIIEAMGCDHRDEVLAIIRQGALDAAMDIMGELDGEVEE